MNEDTTLFNTEEVNVQFSSKAAVIHSRNERKHIHRP